MNDYEQGKWDCEQGLHPREYQPDEYYKGYAFEYEKEQQEDARTS